ncbi:hypothetical protein [Halobacteriovorax sp. DA5]|uniref:hypothetical protein n=1 Tax=Halobacteriovorax sp. DA5 TaxID=2067553 RepID=UPI000CD31CFE|nr:hypothetical protein [Halobacteriovorax sp. DA5]POB13866.1 hypothetical protein C0Z22_07340 [Halobacteriovorax sp. DA5]
MKLPILAIALFGLFSCSSMKEKVIERIDGLDEKPSWATISKPTYSKDGKFYAVGISEGAGNASISALGRISDNNAKTELTRIVSNQIGVVLQNVEEGTDGANLSRFIGTEKSTLISRKIIPEKRYWEKVQIPDNSGEDQLKVRMYSLVSIDEPLLRKMIQESLNQNKEISKELKQKVDSQLDKLMDN